MITTDRLSGRGRGASYEEHFGSFASRPLLMDQSLPKLNRRRAVCTLNRVAKASTIVVMRKVGNYLKRIAAVEVSGREPRVAWASLRRARSLEPHKAIAAAARPGTNAARRNIEASLSRVWNIV